MNNLTTAIKDQGYADLQPVADLASRNQLLMSLCLELYNKIQQESRYSVFFWLTNTPAPSLKVLSRSQGSTLQPAFNPRALTKRASNNTARHE